MNIDEKKWKIALGAICLVYISLRFWNLTDSCLWFDEIFSVHAAQTDFSNLFWFIAQDLIHPPLFYVLLKVWISIGGESLFWLRSFPVLFSIIALVPFYLICRQLKLGFPAVALAFALFAANGALIKYAQEVRMYSVLLCLALFSIWLFLRFFNLGKSFWTLTLINILLIYTHYFGWFVILAEVAAILILQRIKIRQLFTGFGVCLLAFAPWIFAVWRASQINADVNQNLGWAGKPNLPIVFQFVLDLFEPFYFQASSIDANSVYLVSIPILLVIITAFVIYLIDWKTLNDDEKKNFYLLLIFIKTPIAVAFIASWLLPFSIWGSRHLIVVFPAFLILAAIAITKIKFQVLKISFISLLGLLIILAFILQTNRLKQEFIWCAWENLATNLDADQPQKIYVFEDLVAYHFWFAVRESDKLEVIRVKNMPEMIEDKAYFLPRGFENVRTADENAMSGDRFWMAWRDAEYNENRPPLKNLIDKGYKIGEPKVIKAQGLTAILVEAAK